MFIVDDIDDIEDTIDRLRSHGAELLGGVARHEGAFRLRYPRHPAVLTRPSA